MKKDILMPCLITPDQNCPLACPNRQKILGMIEEILKNPRYKDISIEDEDFYADLVEIVRTLNRTSGGPAPELKAGCINRTLPGGAFEQ